MSTMRRFLERIRPAFEEGGRFARLHPFYEALDTFLYGTDRPTKGAPHVRDALDLKRLMIVVVAALVPTVFMAMWNTGYQANRLMAEIGMDRVEGWRGAVLSLLHVGHDPASFWANLLHGALWFLPVYFVAVLAGTFWEVLFAVVRKHEINEGLLVSSLLFPLTLPPAIPLWQVALGMSFGILIAKELFGGTGRNFLNPALAGRAFLYFAYPAHITGDTVWVALDGITRATPLTALSTAKAAAGMEAVHVTWTQAFLGTIPGSMGETSALACMIGAAVLLITGIGSWRIMLSMLLGALAMGAVFFGLGSSSNPMFAMPPHWHLVVGGFAFGLVFMATDPVSAAQTNTGRWIYGAGIGALTVLIRVVNPAYPEAVMLAILLGNVCAPLIDWFVYQANIRRRAVRCAE